MKHPNQGFVKGVKEESPDVIKQLETQGWYRCQSRSDTTPYKEPAKKETKTKNKKTKK
jgi:predicted RNA binding protein YcfA (HicA-like mRNA interferase family)